MLDCSSIETWRNQAGCVFTIYVKSNARYYEAAWMQEPVKTSYPKLRAAGCVRIGQVKVYEPEDAEPC